MQHQIMGTRFDEEQPTRLDDEPRARLDDEPRTRFDGRPRTARRVLRVPAALALTLVATGSSIGAGTYGCTPSDEPPTLDASRANMPGHDAGMTPPHDGGVEDGGGTADGGGEIADASETPDAALPPDAAPT